MKEITFTYGGFNSSDDLNLVVEEIKRGILGDISEIAQEVPAMVGNIYNGTSHSAKKIDIDCVMKAETEEERAEMIHELGNLFFDDSNDEFDLILSDEPQYAYHAHVAAISTPERISNTSSYSSFTITFTCSKPFAYGEQQSETITEDVYELTPDGEAPTYPVFTIIPNTDVTNIAISDDSGSYVFLGQDENTESQTTIVNKEPQILNDACNTLDTWTKLTQETMTFSTENVYISSVADMRSTANSLRIGQKDGKDYFGGNVSKQWHGAARRQMLTQACDDYRVRVRLYNIEHTFRAKNKIEVYLLATDGTRIGKMMLKDNDNTREVMIACDVGYNSDNRKEIYASTGAVSKYKTTSSATKTVKVKVGTKTVTKTVNKKKTKVTENVYKTLKLDSDFHQSTYTDFYGWLQLEKVGNKYTFSFMKLNENGSNAWSKTKNYTYTDTKGYSNKQLGGIAFVISKYDITEDLNGIDYTPNTMALCDVKVWNLIDGGNKANNEPEIVAYAGEEIKIDSEDGRVYRNGVPYMNNFYIGSTFFKVIGGTSKVFSFSPSPDEAEIKVDYVPTKH